MSLSSLRPVCNESVADHVRPAYVGALPPKAPTEIFGTSGEPRPAVGAGHHAKVINLEHLKAQPSILRTHRAECRARPEGVFSPKRPTRPKRGMEGRSSRQFRASFAIVRMLEG